MTPAELTDALRRALADLDEGAAQRRVEPRWRRPREDVGGDWSSGIALELASRLRRPARELADDLAARLVTAEGVADVRVTGPGFLTVVLEAPGLVVTRILDRGPEFLRGETAAGMRVTVSGAPPQVADLRGFRAVALADCLRRLLLAVGADVTTARDGAHARGLRITLEPPPSAAGGLPSGEIPVAPVSVAPPEAGDDVAAIVDRLGVDTLRVGSLRVPAAEVVRIPAEAWARRTEANPAFRLVHAHARASSQVRASSQARASAQVRARHGNGVSLPDGPFDPRMLTHPSDVALLGLLAETPGVVDRAARRLAPEVLVRHLDALAVCVTTWVGERGLTAVDLRSLTPPPPDAHPSAVLPSNAPPPDAPPSDATPPNAPEAPAELTARVRLAEASVVVLAAALDLLGVQAPERV